MYLKQHYRTKPFECIAKVLECNTNGSLSSYLVNKRWCSSLSSYCRTKDSLSFFSIDVTLTNEGFQHLDDVMEATFAFLKFQKKCGPNEQLFREYQTIAANIFHFAVEKEREVTELASNLRHYSLKDVLTGDSLFFEYDAAAIERAIDALNTRTFNIIVAAQSKYDENIQFELKEQWFGTEYSEVDPPHKWSLAWENVQPYKEFSLPAPNPFIADDFTIFYDANHPVPTYPTKILENDVCELWFRQDDKFLLPEAHCNFYFTTPHAFSSTKK